ncbi:MAG: SIMPL domain-containing protein [Methylobacter sp.]|nr:SIMPL domain-containing protein [Methylobacter sp.]MDP2428475.1 SIMPL domain-containing protein [Methylobacter sp.]MDP3055166.1 SIMPL domain-containing protein [Methylobacter sp.]MDP3363666.1 SIMPL domain-containing protein [Methylobacter sp.]MDZ4219773.1 SIMPL domain-containing protein [Methylobacter sp.]
MNSTNKTNALILGLSIFLGLAALGYLLGRAAINVKEYERSVAVKGLSERELPADIVIWPIVFTESNNDLGELYSAIDASKKNIEAFLLAKGIAAAEISYSLPSVTDKAAQEFNSGDKAPFRYVAVQTVTVYSPHVAIVRKAMDELSELGKSGIAFKGEDFQNQTEYLFTDLNKIKPEMIQETTTKAREVALKFAEDSNSKLGKIKQASQGQFSIEPRDKNNPHVKRIRVVSTVEYYLSD